MHKLKELNNLVLPLKKFLEDNYDYHSAIVITSEDVKIISVELSSPLPDR